MGSWFLVGAMVAGGTFIAFQGPINAQLAQRTGNFEAALISFGVGTLGLGLAVLLFGKGDLRQVTRAPPWQWIGGLLGMGYVTLALACIPRLGVTTVMVAGLVGQLSTALALDHFGAFGLTVQPVSWPRLVGVGLLGVALWLIRG